MREAIEQRMREYLAETDPALEWVRDAVRAHHFLPLCFSMSSAVCIRPDGTFWSWTGDWIEPVLGARLRRVALSEGAKRWPELAALIPPRPFGAVDCNECSHTAMLRKKGSTNIMCWCGGLGWVIEDEEPF